MSSQERLLGSLSRMNKIRTFPEYCCQHLALIVRKRQLLVETGGRSFEFHSQHKAFNSVQLTEGLAT